MTADLNLIIQHYKDLPIIKRAIAKLRTELPKDLCYHSVQHTEDVLAEAIRFATHDNLTEKEIHLLAVASAYHDFGFLIRYTNNEQYGADFACMAMQESGYYSPQEIELVAQMIMDTALIDTDQGLKSVPCTKLSAYLLDADMSNLGRDDFLLKTELIAKEQKLNIENMYVSVLKLMKSHNWQSTAGEKLRGTKKEQNIQLIKELVSKLPNRNIRNV